MKVTVPKFCTSNARPLRVNCRSFFFLLLCPYYASLISFILPFARTFWSRMRVAPRKRREILHKGHIHREYSFSKVQLEEEERGGFQWMGIQKRERSLDRTLARWVDEKDWIEKWWLGSSLSEASEGGVGLGGRGRGRGRGLFGLGFLRCRKFGNRLYRWPWSSMVIDASPIKTPEWIITVV